MNDIEISERCGREQGWCDAVEHLTARLLAESRKGTVSRGTQYFVTSVLVELRNMAMSGPPVERTTIQ